MTPRDVRRTLCVFLASFTFVGCKSMTAAKEEALAAEDEKKRNAWEKRLEERIAEYVRLGEAGRSRAIFEEEIRNAMERVEAGDFPGALRVTDAILHPPALLVRNAETGKEELVTAEEPDLEPRDRSRVLGIEGMALLRTGKPDDGIKALETALGLDPSNRPVRRTLGKAHLAAGRHREALATWRREIEEGFRDAALLEDVALARTELARSTRDPSHIEAARIALENVLLEKPDAHETQRRLALLELEAGRPAEAARLLEALLRRSPLDPDHLELLGGIYLKVPDRAKAMDRLELAARVRPPSKDGCRTLSGLLEAEGLPGRAAEWLSRAHRGNPGEASPDERFETGSLFSRAGRDEEAMLWLSAIAEGEPRHAEAQALLAPLYRGAGKEDEAIAAFEKVRKTRPQDGEAHLAAGGIFLARKQLDQALEAYARASSLPDTKVAGLIGMAEVSYEKRNLSAALRHYRRALEAVPGDSRCIRAIQRIEEEMRWSERPRSVASTP